jgi:hypothetical protein
MPKLRPEALSLAGLLARYSQYTVPAFQRVYGWGEAQISRLLSDLDSAMRQRDPWLFLGNIYLASKLNSSEAQIADGQQRILTLTILYAAGRDLEEDAAEAAKLHAFLVAPAGKDGIPLYRFAPRDLDVPFFRHWVQEPGATRRHPAEETYDEATGEPLSDSQANIIGNRDLIAQWLEGFSAEGRRRIFDFLAESTEVSVHTADRLEDVRNAYASTDSRGLAQSETDKLKAELLGDCPEETRARLALQWEACEARLGKERFAELFRCLVFIEGERQPQHSLEADLAKVFRLPGNVENFIAETLVPSAAAYERILSAGKEKRGLRRPRPDKIDGHLVTLMRTSHDIWKGPAILALIALQGGELEVFLRDLERLAAVLMIVGVDPNKMFERYAAVLRELKDPGSSRGSALEIDPKLAAEARDHLRSARFGSRERERFRMPVLLKLNDLLNGAVAAIDPRGVSCEHILPRNGSKSRWSRIFQHPQRGYIGKDYANQLGNLAILTHADNHAADTELFDVKRRILKRSGFALSMHAAKEGVWNAPVIERRSKELLRKLVEHWRLSEGEARRPPGPVNPSAEAVRL